MYRVIIFSGLCILCSFANAQKYTAANVFAHNDYVRANPFYTAYNLRVGYIEADVFLHNEDLLVAHHRNEIVSGKTLAKLYLDPLLEEVRKNNGYAYADPACRLTLMIDLKTAGIPTLNAIVKRLEKYPELISARNLTFMISGSVPDPQKWSQYPAYIYFDGRPGINYTSSQLERISMISASFSGYVKWDGLSPLTPDDQRKIASVMREVHSKGKKFRFWATPDFEQAWQILMDLRMDVIVTDDVESLVAFLGDETRHREK